MNPVSFNGNQHVQGVYMMINLIEVIAASLEVIIMRRGPSNGTDCTSQTQFITFNIVCVSRYSRWLCGWVSCVVQLCVCVARCWCRWVSSQHAQCDGVSVFVYVTTARVQGGQLDL